jgi:PBSX family phage terminase large subunit
LHEQEIDAVDQEVKVVDRRHTFYGAAADYFAYEGVEALCESGAGTGKTFSLLAKADYLARKHPGCRILLARQTRVSMNETVLPDWRDRILFKGHPAISKTAKRESQSLYTYPNGSDVVIGGLENMQDERNDILSAQYDFIFIFQAEEVALEAYEKLITRLRNRKAPYHQITLDVNPASSYHWINLRFYDEGENRRRFKYLHEDNPMLFDHEKGTWTEFGHIYISEMLGALTGIRRRRLLHHEWIAEEGLIYDNFRSDEHIVDAQLEMDTTQGHLLHVSGWKHPVHIEWFGAGIDWGYYPDPGVIQVWGYTRRGTRFRVAEVMKLQWQIDQWADVCEELADKFKLRYIAADPTSIGYIQTINKRLSSVSGRHTYNLCKPAKRTLRGTTKDKQLLGIDLMRWLFRDSEGRIRQYLVRDAFPYGLDGELQRAKRPSCMEMEIPGYVYDKRKGSDLVLKSPDDKCDDHALDAARYDAHMGWLRYFGERLAQQNYPRGSFGQILKHPRRRNAG